MRISDWSSDVCSSDLVVQQQRIAQPPALQQRQAGREHRLQRRVEVRPMELHLAHMADVEKASRRPCPEMLGEDPLILDRHRIVRERHRSEEHTSELQSLMRISYAVFCLKKKTTTQKI